MKRALIAALMLFSIGGGAKVAHANYDDCGNHIPEKVVRTENGDHECETTTTSTTSTTVAVTTTTVPASTTSVTSTTAAPTTTTTQPSVGTDPTTTVAPSTSTPGLPATGGDPSDLAKYAGAAVIGGLALFAIKRVRRPA